MGGRNHQGRGAQTSGFSAGLSILITSAASLIPPLCRWARQWVAQRVEKGLAVAA